MLVSIPSRIPIDCNQTGRLVDSKAASPVPLTHALLNDPIYCGFVLVQEPWRVHNVVLRYRRHEGLGLLAR